MASAEAVSPKKRKQEHRFEKLNSLTLPPGEYYICDTCYVLDSEIYDAVWGDEFKYENGAYQRKEDGAGFMMVHTAHGDGTYRGTDGVNYDVDAGVIGVTAKKLCKDQGDLSSFKLHKFNEPVSMSFEKEGGVIRIKSGKFDLKIKTDSTDSDEEEEEEEDSDEDYSDDEEEEEETTEDTGEGEDDDEESDK